MVVVVSNHTLRELSISCREGGSSVGPAAQPNPGSRLGMPSVSARTRNYGAFRVRSLPTIVLLTVTHSPHTTLSQCFLERVFEIHFSKKCWFCVSRFFSREICSMCFLVVSTNTLTSNLIVRKY